MADQVENKKPVEEDDDDKNGWLSHVVRIALMVWACIITSNYLGVFKHLYDFLRFASFLNGSFYGLTVGRNVGKKKEESKTPQGSKISVPSLMDHEMAAFTALFPISARPNYSDVEPRFMGYTTSTQTSRRLSHMKYGGAVTTYSGTNVEPSTNITDGSATYDIVDTAEPWQLEITTRSAGVIETIDIDRTIDVETTTTSLSVFSN